MKLYYLADSESSTTFYRLTKVYEAYYGSDTKYNVIYTGVLDRAAFFMSFSVAQDVADDLLAIGEYYHVVEFVKENTNV